MPQRPTDIPHFAFTHHRIGLHSSDQTEKQPGAESDRGSEVIGELVPIYDTSNVPKAVQQRNLGLAYFEFSDAQKSKFAMREYRRRAESLLYATHNSPLRDADSESALARIYWERDDFDGAVRLAESALLIANGSTGARTNSLFLLGESRMRQGDFITARNAFEQLVKERRVAEDWVLLSHCHMRTGQQSQAAECLEHALTINPWRPDIHEMLIEIYRRVGNANQLPSHVKALEALMSLPGQTD
jgi:tetratricopeptide (TPR) repeat protein